MIAKAAKPAVVYPSSDGQPMAENSLQWEWIVTIKENLDIMFEDDPNVFVAGDHLIYPVEGNNKIRQAPDAYVALGRPKGHRGSYNVFDEGGIFPQVIFEVLSPGNRFGEMMRKYEFYRAYGAQEYYVFNPDKITLEGWIRKGDDLIEQSEMDGFVSPLLGIRFELSETDLVIYRPDNQPFLTMVELGRVAKLAKRQAEQSRQQAEQARQQAEQARQQAEQAQRRLEQSEIENEKLRTRLKDAGLNGDAGHATG